MREMKAILILDKMPECCMECSCFSEGENDICKALTWVSHKGNEFYEHVDDSKKKLENVL